MADPISIKTQTVALNLTFKFNICNNRISQTFRRMLFIDKNEYLRDTRVLFTNNLVCLFIFLFFFLSALLSGKGSNSWFKMFKCDFSSNDYGEERSGMGCVNVDNSINVNVGDKESEIVNYIQQLQQNSDHASWQLCFLPLNRNVITFRIIDVIIDIHISSLSLENRLDKCLMDKEDEGKCGSQLLPHGSGVYLSACDMKSTAFVLKVIVNRQQPIQIYMTGELSIRLYRSLSLQSYTAAKQWKV